MTVPAVVIGGYLGAGKTTLVNHLLRNAGGRRIAVLVNDFGEVSIDADLIQGADGDVLALAGGCVCCSFGSDLVGTLVRVTSRQPAPDMLLVETSGVGLPAAVARAVRLAPGVTVDGIVVVADASALPERVQDRYVGDVVRQQLEEADLLVINRTDQATPAGLAASRACVAQHAERARVIETVRGAVPPDAVLGPQAWAAAAVVAEGTPPSPGGFMPAGLPEGGRAAVRPPGPATAADRFEAGLELHDAPVSLGDLCRRLQADTRLVRAKGVVLADDGAWHEVHAVGARVETTPRTGDGGPAEPAQAPGGRAGRLAWIRLRL